MLSLKKIGFRLLRTALLGLLLLFATAFTYACLRRPYYSEKYAPVPGQLRPLEWPAPLMPEVQDEGHTCGLLALSAVYRAYGLDPVDSRLRFRLGVDRVAVPGATGTEGTLHPDLFRVAHQDGFRIDILDPDSAGAERLLLDHLAYDAALALVLRGGALHWIAVDDGSDRAIRVSDSLEPEAFVSEAQAFFSRPVLSLLLVARTSSLDRRSVADLHASGLREMQLVHSRMGKWED